MRIRPRRNRKSAPIRAVASETELSADRLLLPLFVHEGSDDVEVPSMPGCKRHSFDGLLREVDGALADGIRSVRHVDIVVYKRTGKRSFFFFCILAFFFLLFGCFFLGISFYFFFFLFFFLLFHLLSPLVQRFVSEVCETCSDFIHLLFCVLS